MHVIVGGDAAFALGGDGKGTRAAENELAFGEEGRLLILIGRRFGVRSSVGEGVGPVYHHKTALFALVIDGGAFGVGEGYTIQDDSLLVLGINFKEAVRRAAGKLVHNLFLGGGIIHGYMVAVYGNHPVCVTAHGGGAALGKNNGNGPVETGIVNKVFGRFTVGNAHGAVSRRNIGLGTSIAVFSAVVPWVGTPDIFFLASCQRHCHGKENNNNFLHNL